MSTGGARNRDRDGRSSPRPRYMAVQAASHEPPVPDGHRRIVGRDASVTMLPGGGRAGGDRGPVRAGMVVGALCVLTAVLLLWAAIGGAAWIVWRLSGG